MHRLPSRVIFVDESDVARTAFAMHNGGAAHEYRHLPYTTRAVQARVVQARVVQACVQGIMSDERYCGMQPAARNKHTSKHPRCGAAAGADCAC